MSQTKGNILCALLITSMIAVALSIHPSYAVPTIYIVPDTVKGAEWTPGKLFNLTAYVDVGTDVAAFQVDLQVDDNVLNITRAWRPFLDPLWIFKGKTTIGPAPSLHDYNYNGIYDDVWVGDTTNPLSGVTFTSKKLLAIIEIKVLSIGYSDIPTDFVDTYLLDSIGEEIPEVIKLGSWFDNRPPIRTARVSLDPIKIADPALTPCNNFNVSVKIINASELNSFQFKLTYNQTILNVTTATLNSSFFPGTPTVIIDNTNGILTFSATITPPAPVSGNGTLAIITFHVVGLGRTLITLPDTDLSLQQKDGTPQPFYKPIPPAVFNNVVMARLYVDPPEIIDPTLHPGSLVIINITIDDVENMYGYEFKLSYDPDILTALGGWVNRVQNEGNFTIQMLFDDIIGGIWVNVTYRPPATPITTFTPAALVTIIFQIDGYGTSVLHLYDTRIVDQTGSPIPHETGDGFIQSAIRDVAIISVVPSTYWAYPGWPVDITVVAKNKGMLNETFDVMAFYENHLIGTEHVVDLVPDAEITLIFHWDTTGVPGDNYTIRGEATTVPYETNTADNILSDGKVEIRSIYRDVAVTNVVPSRSWVYDGWKVNITVTVKNLGNLTETFPVNASYNTHLIGTIDIVDLPAGSEKSVIFTWNTTGVTPGNYTLKGEAALVPFEYNPANNVYIDGTIKIRILGDLNGDGKVDIKDLALAALAFGSYVGHPRYNPDADVNQDGKVDIRDLARIALNFGKTAPSDP